MCARVTSGRANRMAGLVAAQAKIYEQIIDRPEALGAKRRASKDGGRLRRREGLYSAGLMPAASITAAQRLVSSLTTLAACSSVVCCGVVLIFVSRSCT